MTTAAEQHQQTLKRHQQRIRDVLAGTISKTFAVKDTCRFDNGGMLELPKTTAVTPAYFVAFIPAAGAASRYFRPLENLRQQIEASNKKGIQEVAKELIANGALTWPLPAQFVDFLQQSAQGELIDIDSKSLLQQIDLPKALLPAYKNGPNFLTIKFHEHENLAAIRAQVVITPEQQNSQFQDQWQRFRNEMATEKSCIFFAQNSEMCTLRCNREGVPILHAGSPSQVPGGHGTLTQLFPAIREQFPEAEALFIKNIDNVIESSPETNAIHQQFFSAYTELLRGLQSIRGSLQTGAITQAEDRAYQMQKSWLHDRKPVLEPASVLVSELLESWPNLINLLRSIFHMTNDGFTYHVKQQGNGLALLQHLFQRPLNMLGQVPNSGKDVGGTPVFAYTPFGLQKLCMELPHFSKSDVEHFLQDASKATHFNPVFVAAELTSDSSIYDPEDNPFWIVTDRPFQGETVYYHETILYELLGNSLFANCVFVAIPRTLFNPHKTLTDAKAK